MAKKKDTCGQCALYSALRLFPGKTMWCKKDSMGRKGVKEDSPACKNIQNK